MIEVNGMPVKKWFITNFTSDERIALMGYSFDGNMILRETEKAVYVQWDTEFGKICKWVPKSAIYTQAELDAECASFGKAASTYENIVAWAKKNSLPVRNKMKLATIKTAIKTAGLAENFIADGFKM